MPFVAPFTGAWIETTLRETTLLTRLSRPSRARGLKLMSGMTMTPLLGRALHGRVD